jgi:hypothetical protein
MTKQPQGVVVQNYVALAAGANEFEPDGHNNIGCLLR